LSPYPHRLERKMIELTPISEFESSLDRGQVQVLVSAVWDGCGGFETQGLGAKLRPTHFVKSKTLETKFKEYHLSKVGWMSNDSDLFKGLVEIAKQHYEGKE
jgi:hypothetical protein